MSIKTLKSERIFRLERKIFRLNGKITLISEERDELILTLQRLKESLD